MRILSLTLSAALVTCLFAVTATAQIIETPTSVKPIGFTHDYYEVNQPAEESPSDDVVPEVENGGGCDGCCDACGCDDGGCCSSCDCCSGCCCCYLFGPCEPFSIGQIGCCGPTIGGWISMGYHAQPTPLSQANGDLLAFNDVPNGLRAHQVWMYMEKEACASCCSWDWGYRIDFMYGTDAQKTQAFGNAALGATGGGWDAGWDNGIYGWAMPQAYVELARGDLSVIVGHFFTIVGYEVVTAPDNFFYSHALTMFNSEPFTHTGVLASYQASNATKVFAGWTQGWDTAFFRNNNGASSYLGGFSHDISNNVNFTYITTAGNFGARGSQAYSHSMVFSFQMTDRLEYVVQSDLVQVGAGAPVGTSASQVGINQYTFYTVSDCVKLGFRNEWWKSGDNSFHEATFGVNIKPHANLTIRPEIRHDWSPAIATQAAARWIFGIDAIMTF